jgi:hypothetical protein
MSDLADPSVPSDAVAPTSTSEHDGAPSAAPVHDVESSPAQPVSPARPAATPEMDTLLELVRRGLAPDADPTTRAAAREVCDRILHALGPAPTPPAAPAVAVAPVAPTLAPVRGFPGAFAPVIPSPVPAMPTSPLAQMIGVLRHMPADQLLDLAIQRLRAALPKGATVTEPKGIQFQLVPVTPPGDKR